MRSHSSRRPTTRGRAQPGGSPPSNGKESRRAAADPYRLSVRRAPLLTKVEPKVEIIIPARSLFEVARIVDDSDSPVDILVTPTGSQVIFNTAAADLGSRII